MSDPVEARPIVMRIATEREGVLCAVPWIGSTPAVGATLDLWSGVGERKWLRVETVMWHIASPEGYEGCPTARVTSVIVSGRIIAPPAPYRKAIRAARTARAVRAAQARWR